MFPTGKGLGYTEVHLHVHLTDVMFRSFLIKCSPAMPLASQKSTHHAAIKLSIRFRKIL